MSAKKSDPAIDAIALTALAKSQKTDRHRDLLKPGTHDCSFSVEGQIDKRKWSTQFAGTLAIAPDSGPVAASSTPWAELFHAAICSMTERERREFLKTITAGEIPPPLCGSEKAALVQAEMEPALSGYRQAHPSTKRGTVSFSPATG